MANKILISRTDSIGDVMLTLPLAGFLKAKIPSLQLYFLGRTYTAPIIKNCQSIDGFINWDDLSILTQAECAKYIEDFNFDAVIHVFPNKQIAKVCAKAKIKQRIGTFGRWFHWLYCNKNVNFSRKKSDLHEAQLNFKLLLPLGFNFTPTFEQIADLYQFYAPNSSETLSNFIQINKFNLILHPKSKGSAVEWPEKNYIELIETLPQEQFQIFICGTKPEGNELKLLSNINQPNVSILFGKMSLNEYISFININHALLAASTGPLHIAAALNKHALGLYASQKPIHPGRWQPIGHNAKAFVSAKISTSPKEAIENIPVFEVVDYLKKIASNAQKAV